MRPKLLLTLSDLHCGSDVGLMPPSFLTNAGNEIGHGDNAYHQWLWDCWLSMHEWAGSIIEDDSFALLINGDATEGIHHRDPAIVATFIEEHTRMAIQCLGNLVLKADEKYVVKGTDCHTANMEDYLAKQIGAVGNVAKNKWLFKMHGCLIDAAHHMPTTSRVHLELNALGMLMSNAIRGHQRASHEIPQIYARGHRHLHGLVDDGDTIAFSTGAWQALTRYGHKVATDSIPAPSAVLLDWRHVEEGQIPTIHRRKWHLPQPAIHE